MKNKSHLIYYLNVIIPAVFLFLLGSFSIIFPGPGVSLVEKRKLSPVPKLSLKAIFKEKYMDSLDLYFADNFASREAFVKLSFKLKQNRGIHSDEVAIYHPTENSTTIHENTDTSKVNLSDTTNAVAVNDTTEGESSKGVFILKGRALELFGGSQKMSTLYAEMVNEYYEKLKDSVRVFDLIVPSAAEFYLSEKYKKLSNPEKPIIDTIYSQLNKGVISVDAYSEIASHKNEYIYFNTDHHWTGLGAYYGYKAFCKSAGIVPMKMEQMEKRTRKDFLGSLYWLTRDEKLKESGDSVDYFVYPGKFTTVKYVKKNQSKALPASLFVEFAEGANCYSVFLGADYPLMKTETGLKNGKRVLVVKNSYGNPFATLMAAHYEQVFIVDYRYYSGGLLDLIKENKITDVIFINGVFSANTPSHIKDTKNLMYGKVATVKTTKKIKG
ncbi:MAG: hypothetical protein IAF38_22120 [Bacteroidia bacterium]|nr:hypothetical protein [Bacteroidia bacterium]